MTDKHITGQFDTDLHHASFKVLEMGGLVESQLTNAMQALGRFDLALVDKVIAVEHRLNAMEVEIDAECGNIIASALDYLSIASAIERIGDHATNLAERVIYVAKGTDVRHLSREQLEREALRD
ncbi:hypothetical protein DID96_33865 [Burkholderia sp. Bp8963]|uniref:PhoU domain-containing protein n=1 Tax=Burkholderia sp. Bp8963 TaxID=2184547 RepID=UPI000F5A8146|nr:PhoU domain-containing protein [Burkholderia sp. Bp8963]RQS60981.1 hypothetical protein DID96_33865 [Burkholderia sp. Bp8963]